MTRKRIEQKLVALLFVMVLVAFSLAERETKKLERLYNTAYLLKSSARVAADIAANVSAATPTRN